MVRLSLAGNQNLNWFTLIIMVVINHPLINNNDNITLLVISDEDLDVFKV